MSRGSRKQLTVGGLAGAAALAVGNQAYADVLETTFDYTGFTAPIPPDSTSSCFDIDQDGTGDFNISWVNAGAQRVRVNGDAGTGDFPCDATNLVIGGYYGATRFLLDDTIDAGAPTYSRSLIKYSQPDLSSDSFAAVPQAFAGIVFYSTRDNAEHLAWLEFNFDGDGTRSGGKLVGAGWNDVPVGSPGGQTVTAGRLPEPGAASLQAMALGAVTVLARCRARRESARTNAS